MMKRFTLYVWHHLGSIHLTVILCLLLTADLTYGYICLNRHTPLFAPLNDVGLISWMATYGRNNPAHTIWFFILLGLLALFCINTFVCTTDRVLWLIRQRKRLAGKRLLFKLSPHLMHYAVIVILCGYLSSYLFARVLDTQTLIPGATITLPGTSASITFDTFDPIHHSGRRLPAYQDRVLVPRIHLTLEDQSSIRKAVLSATEPVRFKGYGVFLRDFAPRQRGGMGVNTRISLSIRKDPGVRIYLTGIAFFIFGLAIYLIEWIFIKSTVRKPRTQQEGTIQCKP